MKTSKLLLAAALTLSAPAAQADEGMWTLYDLPQAVYNQMCGYGFALPYDGLYNSPDAIKNAVVNFSGYCSGVVVSPDGLVFTNHHCGFEAIRSHSTVEHDYMLNGFYAKTYEEELPNENMFVSFMIDQRDLTPQLDALGFSALSAARQNEVLDSLENALSREVHAQDSTLRLEIKPFYEGNRYYATTYRDFTDLRLVFTIPKSMGKFGGETDNWMWPRQTCDFSVFRIYADPKTGGPAKYSKDNVPYHPKHWAPVSLDGYKDGDFAMTMGYPGSTERYLSSYGIQLMHDAENAPRAQVRGVKQDVMARHMRASEAVRIKYDSKYAQSSNYWKNAIGMNKCIDSIGLVRQKAEYEQRIRAFQDSTGYLKGKLDLDLLARLYAEASALEREYTLWRETFGRTNEFTTRAIRLSYGMPVKGPKDSKKKQYVEFDDNSDTWDAALDREVMGTLLANYAAQMPKDRLPEFYKTIDTRFGGDCQKYADWLWDNSLIMKGGKIYFDRKSYKNDLGVAYGLDVTDIGSQLQARIRPLKDSIEVQERYLCAAKLRMEEDLPHYSDANFTLRLSYGQVGGYLLNGSPSGYYTDAASIVKKMDASDKVADYKAEPVMRDLMSTSDFGQYTDTTSGKMQLCFLTNNDITGGNSGSPVFGGKGQLLGLAFDGNWDSLAGDIWFDKHLGRCICVDIRYMIYLMDKWGHADRLLREIGAKK